MNETRKMYQWFLWFMTFMVLFIEVNLLGSPLIAKVLIKGDVNPIGDIFDWKIWILFLIGFSTLVWWLGRGQYYQSRKIEPKVISNGDTYHLYTKREVCGSEWRKENPRHCPVVLRDGEDKSVGACWHYLRSGFCPVHGQIYEADSK